MAEKIILPKQGLQMTEGVIVGWLKQEGESVREGEPLFEMETDKLTIGIDSTATGTLLKILHPAGDRVPITQAVAIVGEPGEDYSALLEDGAAGIPAEDAGMAWASAVAQTPVGTGAVRATPRARMRAEEKGVSPLEVPATGPDGLVIERDVLACPASPLARKIAEIEQVELTEVTGSGPHGKIMAGDVRAASAAVARAEADSRETVVPLKGMRKVIAQRMKASLNDLAQANHRMTVDMTEAVALRETLKELGRRVSYNDIVLRCTAQALRDFPMMNASMTGDSIIVKQDINLGMAVAADEGLLVPVIRDAGRLNLTALAEKSADLVRRTKENSVAPDELSGGTFTVSNLGMFGVDSFTAIINPPEAGILAVGRMQDTPVVLAGGAVGVRPLVQLSLTYDHRLVDGAPAARFLLRIKELLENPTLLI